MLDRVYYYTDEKGRSPVEEFIRSLPKDEREKVLSYLRLLKDQGYHLRRPIADYVCDDIYELRPKGNRVFYFFFMRENAVLVHSIKKKTDAIPASDIRLAISRKIDFITRYKAGGFEDEKSKTSYF